MKIILRKIIATCLIGIFAAVVFVNPGTVWASTVSCPASYVSTSETGITKVHVEYLLANTESRNGTFTAITMSWEIQSGDRIKIQWWDENLDSLGTSQVSVSRTSARNTSISYPSGAYAAKIVLETGSSEGYRCVWWKTATNSLGNTAVFSDPDLSGNADRSSAFRDLKKMYDYISTPRTPSPIQPPSLPSIPYNQAPIQPPSLPPKTFNPEPPPISEPYQPPYKYERPEPSVPNPESPPAPLPYAPDPVDIPHDDPGTIDNPKPLDPPVEQEPPGTKDPVQLDPPREMDPPGVGDPVQMDPPITMEPPKASEPVQMEPPMVRDPVQIDPPYTKDPVQMDPPGVRDPVLVDPPLLPTPPYSGQPPYGQQNPYTMNPPLTRQPPLL